MSIRERGFGARRPSQQSLVSNVTYRGQDDDRAIDVFDIALKYDRLNINMNQDGDMLVDQPLLRQQRKVNLFWYEKVQQLIYYFQVHALLWLMATQWTWADEFQRWWQFTLVFALDVGSIADFNVNTASQTSGFLYLPFAIFILLLPWTTLVIGYFYAVKKFDFDPFLAMQTNRATRSTVTMLLSLAAQIMYLPLCLFTFRMFTCDANDKFSLDSSIQCWSVLHAVLAAFFGLSSALLIIGVPTALYQLTKRNIVYVNGGMHERYLQLREMEYLIGINNLYDSSLMVLMSSYSRRFAYAQCLRYSTIAVLCVIVTFFSSSMIPNILTFQALLFAIAFGLRPVYLILNTEYRLKSSQRCGRVLDWALFASTLLGILSADDFQSAFFVSYTLARILLGINLAALVLFLILIITAKLGLRVPRLPKIAAEEWNVTAQDVVNVAIAHPDLVMVLNQAKQLIQDASTVPGEFFPRPLIIDTIEALRELLKKANKIDGIIDEDEITDDYLASIKAPAKQQNGLLLQALGRGARLRHIRVSSDKSSILKSTLSDLTEDLAALYASISTEFSTEAIEAERKQQHVLADATRGFKQSLIRKADARALMPNAKRDMLFKLLALRGFLGDDYFYKEDRVLFEIPVVDQKARIDKLLLVAEDEEESLEEFKARKHREAMLKKEELEAKHAKELDDDESLEEFKARKHREAMALKDVSAVNATNNTGMSVSRATDFEDTDDSSSSSEQENPDESLEAFKARKHREALAKRKAQQGDDPQQFRPVLGGLVEADESSSGESSSEDEVAEKANNSQVSFAARQIVRRPRIDESSSSSGSSGTDSSDSEDAAPSLRKPNLAPATKNNNSGGGRPTSSIMRRPLRRAADESSSSSSDSD